MKVFQRCSQNGSDGSYMNLDIMLPNLSYSNRWSEWFFLNYYAQDEVRRRQNKSISGQETTLA